MSRHPVFDHLRLMEDDIADLEAWSRVLMDLGTVEIDVDPKGVRVIGRSLMLLGARLDAQWKAAFRSAGGQS